VQDAFAPVHVAGEEAETDEIVKITLDLLPGASELERDVDDRELARVRSMSSSRLWLRTRSFALSSARPRERKKIPPPTSGATRIRNPKRRPKIAPEP